MGYLTNENYLVVDLATGETRDESLDEEFFRKNIGGAAANLALYEEHADGDPIVLGTGLLTGTLVPGSSLGVITAKSPRTGKIRHAPFMLYGAMEMKYSGYDYVVIKGASDAPVYLWLHDSVADVRDGAELWGKDTWATTDALRAGLGEDIIQVLAVGPAGESGSDLAQIVANYWATGDAWGFGALLGAKKVKAIALRGMGMFDMNEMEPFMEGCAQLLGEVKNGPLAGKKGIADISAALGEDISAWLAPLVHRHKACYGCPVPTNTFIKLDEDPKTMKETTVLEPGVLITNVADILGFKKAGLDLTAACRALQACNRLGLDPVAAADLCQKAGHASLDAIKGALPGLKGPAATTGQDTISPWAPVAQIFADFGAPADAAWWKKRQALAFVFGIHPLFALMAPFLTQEKLLEMVNLGTGMDISAEALSAALAKI